MNSHPNARDAGFAGATVVGDQLGDICFFSLAKCYQLGDINPVIMIYI
jgi:hypothetical protein